MLIVFPKITFLLLNLSKGSKKEITLKEDWTLKLFGLG